MYRVEFVNGMPPGTREVESNKVCFLCEDDIDIPDAVPLCVMCRLANGDAEGGLFPASLEAYLTFMRARYMAVRDRPEKLKALFGE